MTVKPGKAALSGHSGPFGVILADPPWRFRNGGNGAAANHYQTMAPADVCLLPVRRLAAPDAVLILWATWATLPDAMRVIPAWGFEYKSGFPWVKVQKGETETARRGDPFRPVFGTGFWVRGCSEPILLAKRGEGKHPARSWLGLISERAEHSRKPDDIYEYAESFPGPYLELFARRPRPGWSAWGNEIESDITMGDA